MYTKLHDMYMHVLLASQLYTAVYLQDKQELWWLYIVNRRNNAILLPPEKVVGLRKEKNVSIIPTMIEKE